MEIDKKVPFLAKVRKVSAITKNGENRFEVRFVYYASELLHGELKDDVVIVNQDHPLVEQIKNLRECDELRAIPETNEITEIKPHCFLVRTILRLGNI